MLLRNTIWRHPTSPDRFLIKRAAHSQVQCLSSIELPSDVNFMNGKWLVARQRSGHTDSNNASRLSCFAQTPCGQRRKLSVAT